MESSDTTTSNVPGTRATPMATLGNGVLWGATVGCIIAIIAAAWLGGRFTLERLNVDRLHTARAITTQVTTALEPLLNAGDLSAARRVLTDLGNVPGVLRATLTLPDGRIVADSSAKQIEVATLPATWRGPVDVSQVTPDAPDSTFILQTLHVGHRGQLFLRVTVQPEAVAFGVAEYSVFGLIAVVALLLLLLACKRLRQRMRGIALVCDALGSLASSQEPLDQLRVDGSACREAADWNRVLDHFAALQRDRQSVAVRSLLSDNAGTPGRGDATAAGNSELHAAIDLLPTGVLLLDNACCVRTANGAGAALLGLDRTTIIGVDVRTLLTNPAFDDAVQATQRGGHGSERRTLEVDRTASNGGILRVNVRPLRREDQGGALITLEDVTQQRIADAARNQFVAQATHELRAPLTNMRLCLENALDEDAGDIEAVARNLNLLNDETRRLERLVSEMLSVAEIEAGSLSLKADDVRLDRLFEELRTDHAAACVEKGLQLEFDLPPKFPLLNGDRDKLAAALHNLLNNAVKYTPADGRITVSAAQKEDGFVIEMTDTGFGIAAEDQPRIFERFFRARDPRVAKITGTGLGLALSREVARLHGGELTFKSEFNRGTTFTLQLPVALQPA